MLLEWTSVPPHRVTTTELVSAVMGPIPASVSMDSLVMFLNKILMYI